MVFKLDIYGSQILSKYDGKFGKKKKNTPMKMLSLVVPRFSARNYYKSILSHFPPTHIIMAS